MAACIAVDVRPGPWGREVDQCREPAGRYGVCDRHASWLTHPSNIGGRAMLAADIDHEALVRSVTAAVVRASRPAARRRSKAARVSRAVSAAPVRPSSTGPVWRFAVDK